MRRQALTTVPCVGNGMRKTRSMPPDAEPVFELLADAGDALVPAEVISKIPTSESDSGPLDESLPADSVTVIVPTFRRPQLLRRLLDSLAAGTAVPEEIIVVDNDPEGSVDPCEIPKGVRLVHAGYGLNLSAARNDGWRASLSDICIFIDDDNEVDEECINALSEACRDERVGLAGPVIYSGDEGIIWCGGLEISKWTGIARCMWAGEVEPLGVGSQWATAAIPDAFALRHEVLELLGGLDDVSFPFWNGELDLAARVAALGLDRVVVRDARVRHYGNVSENPAEHLVRSTMLHGAERARLTARARVTIHRRHSRGLARYTTLLIFVPLWALATAALCFAVKAPLAARLETMKAIATGIVAGYLEA